MKRPLWRSPVTSLQRIHSKELSCSRGLSAKRTGSLQISPEIWLGLSPLFLSSLAPISWLSHIQKIFSIHEVHRLYFSDRPCYLLFKVRHVEKRLKKDYLICLVWPKQPTSSFSCQHKIHLHPSLSLELISLRTIINMLLMPLQHETLCHILDLGKRVYICIQVTGIDQSKLQHWDFSVYFKNRSYW